MFYEKSVLEFYFHCWRDFFLKDVERKMIQLYRRGGSFWEGGGEFILQKCIVCGLYNVCFFIA